MAYDVVPDRFAPVEVDEVGQIILKARDLLSDPKRWCKGSMETSAGEYCVLGAVRAVAGEVSPNVLHRLRAHIPGRMRVVMCFNDDPSTTHAAVLALLDRAASQPMKGEGK